MSQMKGIEFKGTLNTTEMDAKIQKIKQQLQSINSSSTIGDRGKAVFGEGSAMTERGQRLQAAFNKENLQTLQKEFDTRNNLYRNQEILLKQNQIAMDKAKANSKEMIDLDKKRLSILAKQLEIYEMQEKTARQAISIGGKEKDFGVSSGGGGGAGTRSSGSSDGPDGISPSSMIRGIIGKAFATYAVIQGIQKATQIVGSVLTQEQEQSKRETSIAQLEYTTSGKRQELGGEYLRAKFFEPERAEGMAEAERIKAGTTLTSAIGSKWASLKADPLSFLSGNSSEKGVAAEAAYRKQAYLESVDESQRAAIEANPELNTAFDYFNSNKNQFLKAQQMSGMTDQQLMGQQGFLSASGGQFTTEQKLGAMQGIYGAGGSSAQGRVAGEALQIQRQYGVQGAAGIMGGLSGNIGGGQTGSDSVVRRILADAFSVGLDASKFSRETERFLSISAKFVEQSGARTPEAMMAVTAGMQAPLGTAMADINAMGSAHGNFQSKMGAGADQYSKALQFSKMRSDPNLSQLSEDDRTTLAGFSPDQINAGGTFLETMAKNAGFETYDEFKEKMTGAGGVKSFGATSSPETAQRQKALAKIQTDLGFNPLNKEMFSKKLGEAGTELERQELIRSRDEASNLSQKIGSNLIATGKIPAGTAPNDIDSHVQQYIGMEVKKDKYDLSNTLIAPQTPGVQQGALADTDKVQAAGDQESLTSAMNYMPRYAQSVKDIATISEELSRSLGGLYKFLSVFGMKELSLGSSSPDSTGKIVGPPNGYGSMDWFTGQK